MTKLQNSPSLPPPVREIGVVLPGQGWPHFANLNGDPVGVGLVCRNDYHALVKAWGDRVRDFLTFPGLIVREGGNRDYQEDEGQDVAHKVPH